MTQPHARRRMVLSAATNWLAFALTLLVSFFLAPYLIRKLGDGPYGIWGFVESILAYFTLFDMGVASCAVRFVARHHARGEQDAINRLCSSCMVIFLVAGVAVFVIGAALIPVFVPTLEAKSPDAGPIGWFMLLAIANLAFTLPLSLFPSILDGLEQYALKSIVRIAFLVGRVSAIVLVMEQQPSLLSLGIIITVSNLLEHLVFALLVWRALPALRLSRSLVDRPTLRQVRGYSGDAFIAMIAGRISWQTGSIIIGMFISAAAITHFLIASRLIDFAKTLLRSATTTLTPAISWLEAKGDHEAIRRIMLSATRWVLYLVLPIHVGLLMFGRPFIARWLGGTEYAMWCYPVLVVLSLTLTIGVMQSVAARILYGMARIRLFARLSLLEAIINLVVSMILVGPFGITGIAWAITVPNIVFCVWAIGYTLKQLDMPLSMYVGVLLRPVMLIVLPSIIWAMLPLDEQPAWRELLIVGAIGMIPYALAVGVVEGKWRWRADQRPEQLAPGRSAV